jgi:hypothetical protein
MPENHAVGGQAGHREDAKNLVRRRVDSDPASPLGELAMSVDDRRNPGRVNELAAFQADQEMLALCPGTSNSVRKLIGNSQIELTLHLDLPAARPKIPFDELESWQMRPF